MGVFNVRRCKNGQFTVDKIKKQVLNQIPHKFSFNFFRKLVFFYLTIMYI